MKNIYCGNLAYAVTSEDLQSAFEVHGEVTASNVIADKQSGRSKGFGFVEMTVDSEAESAIEALNGTELEGREIRVNEAKPRD